MYINKVDQFYLFCCKIILPIQNTNNAIIRDIVLCCNTFFIMDVKSVWGICNA